MPTPLPLLLAMAFRLLTDRLHQRLADEGEQVRPVHGFALSHLMSTGGATAVELGAYLGVTKQGAAHVVGELERAGYVERVGHPTDGRSRLIVTTQRGRALVSRAAQIWAEEEADWAGLAGADRVRDLRATLEILLATGEDGNSPLRPIW
ncbi:hypothetical protein GCM10027445_25020 [Amycolatopsis endophytica]|uniref:DNA-binding MarR family transcriptional regulator n=1 Tax=Amycolatopsis endophytica TaxID=860233 RepID=A0A853BDA0_9PSEU|nr:MarR family winged helix-turn-helix transcriptional regulator [Amycolatopsis endophytica]NYI92406.1 DNA-binding MarR family transcriptional regulator [Amycolatopsis endophytica]